jgi:hypothetical protein
LTRSCRTWTPRSYGTRPKSRWSLATTAGMPGCVTYFGRLTEVFDEQRAEPVDVIDVDAERVIAVVRVIARSEKFGTEIDAEWS